MAADCGWTVIRNIEHITKAWVWHAGVHKALALSLAKESHTSEHNSTRAESGNRLLRFCMRLLIGVRGMRENVYLLCTGCVSAYLIEDAYLCA